MNQWGLFNSNHRREYGGKTCYNSSALEYQELLPSPLLQPHDSCSLDFLIKVYMYKEDNLIFLIHTMRSIMSPEAF